MLETVSEHGSPEPHHEGEGAGLPQRRLEQFEQYRLEEAVAEHSRAQARRQLEKSLKRNALSHEGLEQFLQMNSRARAQQQRDASLRPTVSHGALATSDLDVITDPALLHDAGDDPIRRNQSTQW